MKPISFRGLGSIAATAFATRIQASLGGHNLRPAHADDAVRAATRELAR
jgi:hypothetical protein